MRSKSSSHCILTRSMRPPRSRWRQRHTRMSRRRRRPSGRRVAPGIRRPLRSSERSDCATRRRGIARLGRATQSNAGAFLPTCNRPCRLHRGGTPQRNQRRARGDGGGRSGRVREHPRLAPGVRQRELDLVIEGEAARCKTGDVSKVTGVSGLGGQREVIRVDAARDARERGRVLHDAPREQTPSLVLREVRSNRAPASARDWPSRYTIMDERALAQVPSRREPQEG